MRYILKIGQILKLSHHFDDSVATVSVLRSDQSAQYFQQNILNELDVYSVHGRLIIPINLSNLQLQDI